MTDDKTLTLKKDDIVEITIDDISSDGEGIGKADGFTLFVKDAVIGDRVRCKVMKMKKTYGYAKLLEVLVPSPFRVAPRCTIAKQCGGCQIQAMDYGRQLRFKQDKVRGDLIRIGGFSQDEVAKVLKPIVGMKDPFRYRNKAQLPVGTGKDGQPIAGFYASHTHVIVPVTECYIGPEENQTIIAAVLTWMKENNVPAYDEKTGEGLVRHILIRSGVYSQQVMVCLVINGDKVPAEDRLVDVLSVLPGMTSISLNTNTEKTNVVMGSKIRVLWGDDGIEDSLHVLNVGEEKDQEGATHLTFTPTGRQVQFRISPLSFYQVNPRQTEKLYSIVRQYAGLTGNEIVWDLYCGVGTIALFLAHDAKEVYGVEVVPEAIRDANRNAQLNHITNATFREGRVEDVLPEYVTHMKEARQNPDASLDQDEQNGEEIPADSPYVDLIIVDPPRKGCAPGTIQTILDVMPPKVIYVSCDPATLARDLKLLCAGGYQLEAVQPVDQFAHSVHVECCVKLSRKS